MEGDMMNFALRECMKLEYQILKENGTLRDSFSNNVYYLKQSLHFLNVDNNDI